MAAAVKWDVVCVYIYNQNTHTQKIYVCVYIIVKYINVSLM